MTTPSPTTIAREVLEMDASVAGPTWTAEYDPADSKVTSAVMWHYDGVNSPTEITGRIWTDIARLIAHYRTSAPLLARRVIELERENERLREALERKLDAAKEPRKPTGISVGYDPCDGESGHE